MPTLKIGTRDSVLALYQANWVCKQLQNKWPELNCQIVEIKTKGDKILDVSLAKIGDKGLFTRELEQALLNQEIDLAVHSLKDLPTELPAGCQLGAICIREEPRDALVSQNHLSLMELPINARVGTSSLRRKAQLLRARPDLCIEDIRGNVPTRLRKMEENNLDGLVLAAAGLHRLGLKEQISEYLPLNVCLPAVGQGAIALELRAEDANTLSWLSALNDWPTMVTTLTERALLRSLGGGCQVPIAAFAYFRENQLVLDGRVIGLDGKALIQGTHSLNWTPFETKQKESSFYYPGKTSALYSVIEKFGQELGEQLMDKGAKTILDQILQS